MTRHAVLVIVPWLALSPAVFAAESGKLYTVVEVKPVSEFWLNPGFYSYHFRNDKQLDGNNFGLGAEYRYSTVGAVVAGAFRNSDRHHSRYLGWVWQPLAVGPLRVGAMVGAIDGYPKMKNGGWFPLVVPVVGFEYQRVGANLVVVPGYGDRLYGSLSLQAKFRLF